MRFWSVLTQRWPGFRAGPARTRRWTARPASFRQRRPDNRPRAAECAGPAGLAGVWWPRRASHKAKSLVALFRGRGRRAGVSHPARGGFRRGARHGPTQVSTPSMCRRRCKAAPHSCSIVRARSPASPKRAAERRPKLPARCCRPITGRPARRPSRRFSTSSGLTPGAPAARPTLGFGDVVSGTRLSIIPVTCEAAGTERPLSRSYRGARLARMRWSVRRCMLSRRAVSDTLRPQSS